MIEVSTVRMIILRAYYAFIAAGTMAVFWPALLVHSDRWGISTGAQYSLLGAITPLALLGLCYPLRMLPLIMYEFLWKALWFLFVVMPLWRDGKVTPDVMTNVFSCSLAIVLTPIVMPWGYLWRCYVVPWRRPA